MTGDAKIAKLERAQRSLQQKLKRAEKERLQLEKANREREALLQQTIQDLRHAERQLTEKEQFLRSIYNGVECLIFAWDVCPDGNFRNAGWNRAAERATGLSGAEMSGKTPEEWLGPAEGQAIHARFRRCVRAGIPMTYEECLTIEGAETWWLTTLTPLVDAAGEIYRLLGTTFNITSHKRVEQALNQSQQLLQLVMNNIPQAIFWKNRDRVYMGCNRKFASDANLPDPAAIVGKTDFDLPWTPAEAEQYRACDQRVLDSGDAELHILETQRHADGSVTWLDTNKIPLHDAAGNVVGILGTYEDITERKQAEVDLKHRTDEAERAMRELQRTQMHLVQSEKMSSLGQLVAGVAHEINNPVNFIYGNLSHASDYINDLLRMLALYQKGYPSPHADIQDEAEAMDLEFLMEDLPKLLRSMRVGAERIQKIVASLRTFSRMDESDTKVVDIHEGIDSTLMILHNRLKAKSDRPAIDVQKNYGNLPAVECYPGQLNQVFMNLLSNAIDALEEVLETDPTFAPQIRVETTLLPQGRVQICIADNGPGISETVRSRLFDPFFTTKPVGKGTGMGLSISYQIVTERHGGAMDCISEPGQGAEFRITLPPQVESVILLESAPVSSYYDTVR